MLNVLLVTAALSVAAPPAPAPVSAGAAIQASAPVVAPSVADTDLQDMRGGFDLPNGTSFPTAIDSALSSQDLSGYVGSNSVTAGSISSGSISFDGHALSGFSGVGNFLLNTGVNSLLQGAVNVTVNLAPATAR